MRQWWPQITNYPLLETSKRCIHFTQWVEAVLIVPPPFQVSDVLWDFLYPNFTPSLFLWIYIWGWCGYYFRDPLPSDFLVSFLVLLLLFLFELVKWLNQKKTDSLSAASKHGAGQERCMKFIYLRNIFLPCIYHSVVEIGTFIEESALNNSSSVKLLHVLLTPHLHLLETLRKLPFFLISKNPEI